MQWLANNWGWLTAGAVAFLGLLLAGVWLRRRLGRRWSPAPLGFALVATALCGLWFFLYLEHVAPSAEARVTARREIVLVGELGAASHEFLLAATLPAAGTRPATPIVLRATEAVHARVSVGDTVSVRYFPLRPALARLQSVTTTEWLLAARPGAAGAALAVALSLMVIYPLAGVFRGGLGLRRRVPAYLILVLWAVLAAHAWPPVLPIEAARRDLSRSATGVLRKTTPVETFPRVPMFRRGRPLPAAIDVVEVEYRPHGRVDPVVGVEAIDRGSLPRVERGRRVGFRHAADDPRRVRLDGATRRFHEANRAARWIALVASTSLGLGWILLCAWAGERRGRSRAQAPRVPER